MDNIFIERLWRSLEYEWVYLHSFEPGSAARQGIGGWVFRYNQDRPHSSLDDHTPDEMYHGIISAPPAGLRPAAVRQPQAARREPGDHLSNTAKLSKVWGPPLREVDPGIRTACQGGSNMSFAVTQPLGVNDMGLELENAGFVDGFRSEYPA